VQTLSGIKKAYTNENMYDGSTLLYKTDNNVSGRDLLMKYHLEGNRFVKNNPKLRELYNKRTRNIERTEDPLTNEEKSSLLADYVNESSLTPSHNTKNIPSYKANLSPKYNLDYAQVAELSNKKI
jgi:hypothetical protein